MDDVIAWAFQVGSHSVDGVDKYSIIADFISNDKSYGVTSAIVGKTEIER